MARRHPTICVVNQSTILDEAHVQVAIRALQRQVTYHFEPVWNAGATLWSWPRDSPIPDQAWALIIADDSDQAGALGYHEVSTHSGQPIGFVFAKTDKKYGLSWSVTASHELLEMLGDPRANLGAQVDDRQWLAYESADAVEADELGYLIEVVGQQVLVSDFVTPEWFDPSSDGPWDYRGHCSAPLQVLPGGYIGVWTPTSGWSQQTNGEPRHRDGPRFRLRARSSPVTRAAESRRLGGESRVVTLSFPAAE
jgi:hypothetical protein